MNHELNFSGKALRCNFEWYEWPYGIAVNAIFTEKNHEVGAIKFLCDESNEKYNEISNLSEDDILDRLVTALKNKKLDSSIQNMFTWQSEVAKNGFNKISPIIAQLSDAF
ncbi:MAG: hypothetical protein ACTJIB_15385 [Pseudoalteromonas prydzensis]|uniref:Uncharacterized protein n=1 Tax=Pseudoalteromonas prydzensis TaxID=182141 RepID=A0ABR9FHL5_9GAMM|nr:hypothetical protein [Pseudoalteromonas prydzensis]MBE0456306.1 hypothetical protein [Pseudoalteromonas prydzensis]